MVRHSIDALNCATLFTTIYHVFWNVRPDQVQEFSFCFRPLMAYAIVVVVWWCGDLGGGT